MVLGRIVGNFQCTVKNKIYQDLPLMVVEPLGLNGLRSGREMVAVDRVGAGIGETVLVNVEGDGAAEAIGRGRMKPVDAVIVAIVDGIKWGE